MTERSRRKEIKDLIHDMRAAGLTVVFSQGTGHWKLYRGDELLTTMASSPRACGFRRKVMADLKRHGIQLPRGRR